MVKRIFCGIKIKPNDYFLESYDYLKQEMQYSKIKWVESHNIHITLKFFGDTDTSVIPQIEEVLEDAGKLFNTFDINISGAGFFGQKFNPRVIWFGLQNIEQLKKLAEYIDEKISLPGINKEKRDYKPHLTLGRINYYSKQDDLPYIMSELKDEDFQTVKVDSIQLLESKLTQGGPIYTIINNINLNQQ